ncbi:MAG: peptidase, partial [Rikenellaceae bacterium]
MQKRIKTFLIGAACVATIALTTASIAQDDFKAGKSMEIFFNVLRTVNLEYVDKVDNDKLLRKATDEMLSTLDPYTVYLDEKDMAQFKMMTTGKYGGVGSLVKAPKENGYASISTIYKGFPMHVAGVTPGDTIIAIDGVSMKGLPIATITD